MRVYLAGNMGGRLGVDVLDERRYAAAVCESLGLTPIDPAQDETIDPAKPIDLALSHTTMQAYVTKDEHLIRTCDAVIVLTGDTPSEGTGMEFALAIELGLPVILVAPRRVKGELMGFWNIKASALFATVEEAVEFLAESYWR